MPRGRRLIEPFAGSAAITLAAASRQAFGRYVIGDALRPLAQVWELILTDPEHLCSTYERLWRSQLADPRSAYDEVRRQFNAMQDPALLLYLLARCVKASVRFNGQGEFNQSPDNRRLGMRPQVMRREIMSASALLDQCTEVVAADFRDTLSRATPEDVVYMDPPYQGISGGRDRRYFQGVTVRDLVAEMRRLNAIGIPFLLSYDGACGERKYGEDLPDELNLARVLLQAGRSSQSTLVGREEHTVESLYISPAAQAALSGSASVISPAKQLALYP